MKNYLKYDEWQIIEEGFEIDDLARIVASMDEALGECGANLVTGDTKVMERGALDGIAINTSGIGIAKTVVRDNGLTKAPRFPRFIPAIIRPCSM